MAGLNMHKPLLVSLKGIEKEYRSHTDDRIGVFENLNLEIYEGDFISIRGQSGSGKTTLFKILGLMDSDFDGRYVFCGQDVGPMPSWRIDELRAQRIGYVFQEGRFLERHSLSSNITLPTRLRGEPEKCEAQAVAEASFFKLTDSGILSRYPREVSGGERQRAAIWRSIVHKPQLILADEPTASLDPALKEDIFNLFLGLNGVGYTVVVISHDEVFNAAPRHYNMEDGLLLLGDEPITKRAAPPDLSSSPEPPYYADDVSGWKAFFGWRPRAPLGQILQFALHETFSRWAFVLLTIAAMTVGVAEAVITLSVNTGANAYIDSALRSGSRLMRLDIWAKQANLDKADRFPDRDEIAAIAGVTGVTPRRESVVNLIEGDDRSLQRVIALRMDDPEFTQVEFLSAPEGAAFSSHFALEAIVTTNLVSRHLGDAVGPDGRIDYADLLGRELTLEFGQYASSEVIRETRRLVVRIVGVITQGEPGRELYMPLGTVLAIDSFRYDRQGRKDFPLAKDGRSWSGDTATLEAYSDFPWENELQVYVGRLNDVLPTHRALSSLGYAPQSEIFAYKWVIGAREVAKRLLVGLLVILGIFAGAIIVINILSAAKIRESEYALMRIVGMRRGDLVAGQLLSATFAAIPGILLGSVLGWLCVALSAQVLKTWFEDQDHHLIFAPLDDNLWIVWAVALVLTLATAFVPALRVSTANPVRLLT